MKNVKARVSKGTGIVNKMMTMLEGIPFGKYYFQVAIMLRIVCLWAVFFVTVKPGSM